MLGTPTKDEIYEIENEVWRNFVKKCKKKKRKSFEKVFPDSNSIALDLLKKLLVFDPKKRITVNEALAHEYLAELHIEDDEPEREEPISPLEFEFESHKLNGEQLKGTYFKLYR